MVATCPICLARPSKPGHICSMCRSQLGGMSVTDAIAKADRERAAERERLAAAERERLAAVERERLLRNAAAAEAARVAGQAPPPPEPAPPPPPSHHDEHHVDDAVAALEQAATSGAEGHGLGDTIAVVAKAFGFVQTPGCGCQQRQANLNYVNFNQSPVQVAKDIWSALRVNKAKKEPKVT